MTKPTWKLTNGQKMAVERGYVKGYTLAELGHRFGVLPCSILSLLVTRGIQMRRSGPRSRGMGPHDRERGQRGSGAGAARAGRPDVLDRQLGMTAK
jgi:hypothetical protein